MPARRPSSRNQLVVAVLLLAAGAVAAVRALDVGFWETTRRGIPLGLLAVAAVLLGAAFGYRALRARREAGQRE
ncbi:hypothetical protein GCM10023340_15780 [Nocardioides marinquilinus]|uniref:Uncharacterized protein n=1 Tax=Nocardioides marinquilinus TaxID=1210400 RepID=A0ABP9PHI6_9ACTN